MSEIKTIDDLVAYHIARGHFYLQKTFEELKRIIMEQSVKEVVLPNLTEEQQKEFLEKWRSITDSVTQPDTKIMQPALAKITLDSLDAMADVWAKEISLDTIIQNILDSNTKGASIDAICRESFVEGAYRLYLKLKAEALPTPPEADND